MSNIKMKEMLAAGMHFGHQTRRWNPKMKPYIFGARNKIYVINLDKTLPLFNKAYDFIANTVADGGTILFVGTKRQAQETIKEETNRCGMFFINHRWLGGMLTNFQTIKHSVDRMKKIQTMQEDGTINQYKKKEALMMKKDLIKLQRNLGGIQEMKGLPSAIFIIDPHREDIAVSEANKLGIPIVAITDTNCNPDGIDYIIPGNDDAIKCIKLITGKMADAVLAGKARRGEIVETNEDLGAAMAAANTETPQSEAPQAEA
ncbi:MAG: 30S ribosomal protein S2 [Desulfurivibrionaceae bacterium]|nr:30S ribosomal protein S2 [Desulfurivibrionaceae bacterium]